MILTVINQHLTGSGMFSDTIVLDICHHSIICRWALPEIITEYNLLYSPKILEYANSAVTCGILHLTFISYRQE